MNTLQEAAAFERRRARERVAARIMGALLASPDERLNGEPLTQLADIAARGADALLDRLKLDEHS